MKRKVIQIAESTQLISLPRKWAKEYNIQKGDELEITEQGNQLLVSTEKDVEVDKAQIDITNLDPIVPRILHALYKKGCDEIYIKYSNPTSLIVVQNMLKEDLIGYEIIKQGKDHCVIKTIAGAYEREFESMLRRIFLVLNSMSKGILEAMENGDIGSIRNLRYLETINNKATGFCRRIINIKGYADYKNTTFMYCLVEGLEKVADQYKYLCDFFLRSKNNIKNINKNIIKLYSELNEMLVGTYELFYKFEMNKLLELFEKRKRLVEESLKLFERSSAKNAMLGHYLLNTTQLIANILSFKLEMTI